MISFLLSPFGKIISIIAGIIMIFGVVWGFYELKISEAKKQALSTFNQTQLEEVLKEKNNIILQMQTLQQDKQELEDQNSQLNDKVNADNLRIDQFINSLNDNTLDPIFNRLLNKLRNKK